MSATLPWTSDSGVEKTTTRLTVPVVADRHRGLAELGPSEDSGAVWAPGARRGVGDARSAGP